MSGKVPTIVPKRGKPATVQIFEETKCTKTQIVNMIEIQTRSHEMSFMRMYI